MIPLQKCLQCKNYERGGKCSAFPEGIPIKIISGKFVHTKKFPNQENDIVFEPIRKKIVKK